MDIDNFLVVLILVTCMVVWQVKAKGYCNFPSYLSSPLPEGNRKYWKGKTEYIGSNTFWDVQEEINVKETEIDVKIKSRSSCNRKKRHVVCYDHNTAYKIVCLTEERHDKYRVQIISKGEEKFSCIKFIQRNENIVQVYKAEPSALNEDKLCHDTFLIKEDWPWLLPKPNTWKFCPNIGGYDFRSISPSGQKCETDWLPSRLESECVIGDSMVFIFSQPSCAPFRDFRKGNDYQMQCWGDWIEDGHMYVLFGEPGVLPRYTLRLPKEAEKYARDEFDALLFLNAIIPKNITTTPHWTLNLLRSGPGVCYDDSEYCKDTLKCSSHGQFKEAKHCRKSCGLCDLAPTDRTECHFRAELQGNWILFTENGQQEVSISGGELIFSTFGSYHCKSMHWDNDYYKVMSTYDNGCRPRYTCLKIVKGPGDTLAVQLSRNSLSDKSFELCQFQDDNLLLGSFIHSSIPKQLLPIESMFVTSCQLNGQVSVDANIMSGKQCDGRMSDINDFTCQPLAKLTVNLGPSCHHISSYEFECIASADLDKGSKILVTQYNSHDGSIHICWKIQLGVAVPNKYTRITCDSAVTYTNKTNNYQLLMEKEDGIASLSLKNDFESDCGGVQEDGTSYDKHPWPDDVFNKDKHQQYQSTSVYTNNVGNTPDSSERMTPISTLSVWPVHGQDELNQEEEIVSNTANSAIYNRIFFSTISIYRNMYTDIIRDIIYHVLYFMFLLQLSL